MRSLLIAALLFQIGSSSRLDALAAVVFAVGGLAVLWRRDRRLALLLAGTAGYFLLISAGAEAEARFRVPVVPQIVIAAGVGIDALRHITGITESP